MRFLSDHENIVGSYFLKFLGSFCLIGKKSVLVSLFTGKYSICLERVDATAMGRSGPPQPSETLTSKLMTVARKDFEIFPISRLDAGEG